MRAALLFHAWAAVALVGVVVASTVRDVDRERKIIADVVHWVTYNGGSLHDAVEPTFNRKRGWMLRVKANRTIAAGEMAVSIPERLELSAVSSDALASVLETLERGEETSSGEGFEEYRSQLYRQPPPTVPLLLPKKIADACLAAHQRRVYDEMLTDALVRGRRASHKTQQATHNGVILQTRAFARDGKSLLTPLIDLANHVPREFATTDIYTTHDDTNGTTVSLLVLRNLTGREEITFDYGNIQSWVDSYSTYAFADEQRTLFLPAQIRFPKADRAFQAAKCATDARWQVKDGAPTPALLLCAQLALAKSGKAKSAILAGAVPPDGRLDLETGAYRQLASVARRLLDDYAQPIETQVECEAAFDTPVASWAQGVTVRDVVIGVRRADRLMFEAMRRAYKYCAAKERETRAAFEEAAKGRTPRFFDPSVEPTAGDEL